MAKRGRYLVRFVKRGLVAADRIALVALGGIVLAVASWALMAVVQTVFLEQPIDTALLSPSTEQMSARLITIVLVLLATLLIQMVYAKHLSTEEKLRLEQARIALMYENSPESILCLDRELNVVFANPAAEVLAKSQAGRNMLGHRCYEGVWCRSDPCEGCLALEVLASGRAAQRTVHDDGPTSERWLEQVVYPVHNDNGDVESLVEVTRDTTARVRDQQTIQHMAYHDSLTQLPNRLLFLDRLRKALALAKRHQELVAVAFVDVDDFKAINDTLGHAVGDSVLKQIAVRLRELLRGEDTVARQSGDEFTVLARLETVEDARVLADRILASLATPISVDEHELHVSASIGIATYPADGTTEMDLLKNADTAMYRAKEWGHNVYRLYDSEMSESTAERLEFETSLRHALERGEFVLHYQPQFDVEKAELVGLEALLRWNHPSRGLLAPAAFLHVAEAAGLMGDIGQWVLESACVQARTWLDQGLAVGRMAVNLSAREFVQKDIPGNVARVLASSGLEPDRLELEITETTAMHNVDQVLEVLTSLRLMGVRVAIDDFGTGYSSLSSLRRFPFSTLKIAQAFMSDVHVDRQSAAIAAMLIDLCDELELDIVAEGVEHGSQLDFLRRHGCHIIQGNFFSEPLPADAAGRLLRLGAARVIESRIGSRVRTAL